MIVGLEWIVIALAVLFILFITLSFILSSNDEVPATPFVTLAFISFISFLVMAVGTISAQKNVEDHYIDYIKLQIVVANCDSWEDLGILDQYDVITYNQWYERNKSDLENEWTFKGTSSYAKEFDYIVIGGK